MHVLRKTVEYSIFAAASFTSGRGKSLIWTVMNYVLGRRRRFWSGISPSLSCLLPLLPPSLFLSSSWQLTIDRKERKKSACCYLFAFMAICLFGLWHMYYPVMSRWWPRMAPWGPDLCGGLWDNELARKQNAFSGTLVWKKPWLRHRVRC